MVVILGNSRYNGGLMKMQKLLSTILITSLLVLLPMEVELSWATPPRPDVLPWKTLDEMSKAAERFEVTACPQGPIIFMKVPYKDFMYVMVTPTEDAGPIAFAFDPAPTEMGAPYTEVGLGVMNPAKRGEIPPLKWEPYVKEIHADICPYLFPERT